MIYRRTVYNESGHVEEEFEGNAEEILAFLEGFKGLGECNCDIKVESDMPQMWKDSSVSD